jgi:hypothetical protein
VAGLIFEVFGASPTKVVVDGMYTWGNKTRIRFEGQNQYGATFGKFNRVHGDSIQGTGVTKSLFGKFIPDPGIEYVLCRDTLGSYVHEKRDTSNLVLVLNAYIADTAGTRRLVGSSRIDSMGGVGNGTKGSLPQQVVIPFGQTIIGDHYDLNLVSTTAKDSVYLNFFYLKTRGTKIGN